MIIFDTGQSVLGKLKRYCSLRRTEFDAGQLLGELKQSESFDKKYLDR